ncbi:protein kinase domain-containing protein [Calothrix sp. 336/3]|uniref:protein kinase domain-containing protein n=1 Tax=Calothrix sp. 336/3 TaxID=1337936 RepID=UPI0004E44EB4|nr:AAA family ATPase [Calothrix sp. 336/3]AKG22083.1 histidine kinase [Calothrix sp. 336/3]
MITTQVSISGYKVGEQLYDGSRTQVYRCIREADSLPVVIKLLKNSYPSFNELLQFRHQYTIGKSLLHPRIVQTYSLESCQNSYGLVMEDFGGISLKDYFTKNHHAPSLEEFFQIAISLCETLDVLYRHRIIHKDIKPSNILINPKTKEIKLIDFSIASLLPRETQEIKSLNVLEGTLAYIAPEQTGRMNRGIDYRSDLYSLGVTFYELLTGELPFICDDAMELVHCHIAKKPPSIPSQKIPQVLDGMIQKLMAKNAEDRYQSALGLKYDLEKCLVQLQENGRIESFPIAQRDLCDRFLIPDKLYGRETEVETLLEAFVRVASVKEKGVSNGVTEMVLIAGFSGIGKTAVVNEVHKPIVRKRGYFIKGKFDQFNRNVPLSAFVQAFRNLLGQLLSESDAQLGVWRSQILEAIGTEGQVLIEVIPELQRLIGVQPGVEALSGMAVQQRFNRLFQQFLGVFTRPEHPLVLFLDDLQWADNASLKLLQLLMEDGGNLLILGAYRDNEVSPIHPFVQTVEEVVKAGHTVNTITLKPLELSQINRLVADTLGCDGVVAAPLTELIAQKTQGNPFFTTQFLLGLHQDGYITFNREAGIWECDIVQVRSLALTDDVVAFMVQQLQKLPASTQIALQRAACIGSQFDLKTLAIICEQTEHQAAEALWSAIQGGLILPINENYKFFHSEQQVKNQENLTVPYKFLHDRVQQASYALIAEEQKQIVHRTIGQLLWQNTPESERESQIFHIVNQLNQGDNENLSVAEGVFLAELNLMAARKARQSTAYGTALNNGRVGIGYLPDDAWQTQYSLTLALHTIVVETAYLSGDFTGMEAWAAITLPHCQTILDSIPIQESKILACLAQQQPTEAIAIGLESLKLLGVDIPAAPTQEDFQEILQATVMQLGEVGMENLLDIPPMDNPQIEAAMGILIKIGAACMSVNPLLSLMGTLTQVQLSLKHGHNSLSAIGYSYYVILLYSIFNDFDAAFRLSNIALELSQRFFSKTAAAQVLIGSGIFARHWKVHLREALPLLRQGTEYGVESGEYDFTSWGYFTEGWILYFMGTELSEVENFLQQKSAAIAAMKQSMQLSYNQALHQATLNLMGEEVEDVCTLTGSAFNEAEGFARHQRTGEMSALFCGYLHKLILSYRFGRYKQAIAMSEAAFQYVAAAGVQTGLAPLYWFTTLAQLAVYDNTNPEEQAAILERVDSHYTTIQHWASHAPMNYAHYADLVAAEKYRCLGETTKAITHYGRAIQGAKENGYLQDEALANELTAKFYLGWSQEKAALGYMQEAYYCYARWGAKAKTDDLEERYPQLIQPILHHQQITLNPWETIATIAFPRTSSSTRTSTTGSTSISHTLDFSSILKAAQAISSSIQLEELITNLTQIILENSGAKKSVLILPHNHTWQVRAITFLNSQARIQTTIDSQSVDTCPDIPRKIINYVRNTQEIIIIDDCQTDIPGLIGEYILEHQPKSVLCTPIMNQGHLVGILYLENQIASGVFTKERMQVINLLSSQAGISLDNCQLYTQQQEKIREIAEKESEYRSIFECVNDGLSICDLETGKIVANNPMIYQMHGYTQEEWQYLTPGDFLHSDSVHVFSNFLETIKLGKHFYAQGIAKRKDGSFFDFEVKAVPFIYKGKLHGLTILRDISQQQREQRERQKAELSVQQKSQELEQALQELQQAQLQIVQNEKMSALGNLVAGVAHEMNNPLGFISATLKQAKPTLADITEHLKLYQGSVENPDTEILEHAAEIDLEYTLEDFPKMLDAMVIACDRLKNISTSLRTFSRADKDYKVPFNLHEGIDSTILILKHRLKANEQRPAIEVVSEYGSLPKIDCFPGQLNQVFMNILANAIDALDESNTGRSFEEIKVNPNKIIIKTSIVDNQVQISIADNGKGMSESIKEKIFDHLFTTKAVGKGTGLGLAIAKQIIEETHGGKLQCDSVLGEGTVFIISIPISQSI